MEEIDKDAPIYDDSGDDYENIKRMKKQRLVRNEFEGDGRYGFPLIKKQDIDLEKIELWNFTKKKPNDE